MVDNIIHKIISTLESIREPLLSAHVHHAHIAAIEPVKSGETHLPIEQITPTYQTGADALKLCLTALTDLTIKSGVCQKSARRYIGAIILRDNENNRQLVALLDKLNQLKEELKNTITQQFHDRQSRFQAVHDALPGAMTVHLYRKTHLFIDDEIDSISFTWQQKSAIVKPNKKQLISQIESIRENSAIDQMLPLSQLLTKVASCPQVQLRVSRGVKVQPSANLFRQGKVQTVTAPLPIILLQSHPTTVKPIPTFNQANRRKKRSDKKRPTVLGTLNGQTILQRTDIQV